MKCRMFFLLVVTACVAGIVACSHVPQTKSQAAAANAMVYNLPVRMIDAHAHFSGRSPRDFGPDEAISEEMKGAGVVGVVVHAPRTAPIPPTRLGVGSIRYRVCGAAVPGNRISDYESAIEDDRIHCLKIYLGYIPKFATDPAYTPYYRLAERRQVPVVFHTGDTYEKTAMVKYADPIHIDEIAVAYPKVTFVVAHLGNPWIYSAAEVVYKNDNVYADLSALMIGDIEKASSETVDELIVKPVRWAWNYVENPRKLMFGSDWPLTRVGVYARAISKAIPREHWNHFFYENATAVFGFDRLTNRREKPNAVSRR